MDNLYILADFAGKPYYLALFNLKKLGFAREVHIGTTRVHHLILQKICYHIGFCRSIVNKILQEKITHMNPSSEEIVISLFFPFRLLFAKNIIIAIELYSPWIFYMIILKLLGKNIVFYNSIADIESIPKKPVFLSYPLWKIFLKNLKVGGVTRQTVEIFEKFGARTFHIPHSVDSKLFAPEIKQNKKLKVLFVGRIDENKGILYLIEAISNLDPLKFEFILAGKGELVHEVVSMSKQLPIKYIGYISDKTKLAKVYSSCDIFILPSYKTNSWEELFGISLIEAMSSGLACIATDCVGPKEIIDNNTDGILIKQKDCKSIVKYLNLLHSNPKLRSSWGNNARKKILSNYDVDIVSKKWIEVIKDGTII